MCYRCQICPAVVGPRIPLTRWVVSRRVPRIPSDKPVHRFAAFNGDGPKPYRLEIAAEIPVCRVCHAALAAGQSLSSLKRAHRKERPPVVVIVASPQPPKPIRLF